VPKFFLTKITYCLTKFSHIFSKIKAVFRFLTDSRLSVSTLLTADCGHKKSVNPLDKLNIAQNLRMSI
jgi:hypothetical protein